MKRNLFLIGFCLFCSHCMAWELVSPTGSRSAAMGNCSVASRDFWSIHNNIAGIAGLNEFSLGISYENRFLMKELSYLNAGLSIPINNKGCFALSISSFGFANYLENNFGIGYARNFGPYLKIGLKIDYLLFKFPKDYNNRQTFTFELGVQTDINEKLIAAVYIFNPINVKTQTLNKDNIPIIFRTGLSYKLTNDFLATTEIEYNSEKSFDYRIGLEYNVLKGFFVRAGVYTNPATACFGAGLLLKKVTIDFAAEMNQVLGISLQGSLVFRL